MGDRRSATAVRVLGQGAVGGGGEFLKIVLGLAVSTQGPIRERRSARTLCTTYTRPSCSVQRQLPW